jgi:hypothetical protein
MVWCLYDCHMALFGRPSERDDRRAEEYAAWVRKRNPFAIGSFVFGLFSFIEFGALFIFGLAGIGLGVVALVQLGRVNREGIAQPAAVDSPDDEQILHTHGHRLAYSGIVLSVVSLVIAAVLYFRIAG